MRTLALALAAWFALGAAAQDPMTTRVYNVRDLASTKLDPVAVARAVVGKAGKLEVRNGMIVLRAPAKVHERLNKALLRLRRRAPGQVLVSLRVVSLSAGQAARWRRLRRRGTRHGALWSAPLSAKAEAALIASGTVLTAPRVMAREGQRAKVSIVEKLNYVAMITPAVGKGGKPELLPRIDTLQLGWTFDMTGWASPDRKRVRLFASINHASAPRPFAKLVTRWGTVERPQVALRQHGVALDIRDGGARVVLGIRGPGKSRRARCPLARLLGVRHHPQLAVVLRAKLHMLP